MNIQDWFPLGWIGLISLQSKGLSRVFSNTQFKSFSSLVLSFLYGPTLTPIHDCWKSHSFDYTFVCKVMSLLFNMLSRFVTAFLPRNSSVQFSHWVMSDSFGPHGLQHTRPPCPSPTPRVYTSSCHLSWWCHPAILSSIVPIFSHPQSFPTLNLFQHQGLFKWDSSSHQVAKVLGVSASTSVLPMNIQDWSSLGWTGWISLHSKGFSRVFSNTTIHHNSKSINSSVLSFLYNPTLTSIHGYWKNHNLN